LSTPALHLAYPSVGLHRHVCKMNFVADKNFLSILMD
jgi:hypothetical protein